MQKSPPIRPGLVLKVIYLEPNNMTLSDLAKCLDISYNSVSQIISGRASITPAIALKLADIFPTTDPEFWINLQNTYDLWYAEGNRGTDEPFYQLMSFGGEAILKLIGAETPVGYKAKAFVLKEKSLYPDLMAVPEDPDSNNERIFIEFQAYTEKMIRHITASKVTMFCAHDDYSGPVLSAIIFTDQIYQDKALPLTIESKSKESLIQGRFKEIVLSTYTEQKLIDIDPRLVILAPFTISKTIQRDELAQKCHSLKTLALKAYPDSLDRNVLNVLSLFILNRFNDLSIREVRAMLNFDLSNTKAGMELINIGRQEGHKEGRQEILYSLLCNRFGNILPIQKENFFSVPDDVINNLANALFNFRSVDEFALWWSLNGHKQTKS